MTEGSKLAAFLLALQTSPSVQKRFTQDEKKELKRFGLATATVRAVLDRELSTLWEILSIDYVPHIAAVIGVRRHHRRRGEPDQIAIVVGAPPGRRKPKRPEQIAVVVGYLKRRRRRRAKRA